MLNFASRHVIYLSIAISCAATGFTGPAGACVCSSEYEGTVSYVNGQPTGCTPLTGCGTPTAPEGYLYTGSGTAIGSSRLVSCATGWNGFGPSITCEASSVWTLPSGCRKNVCVCPFGVPAAMDVTTGRCLLNEAIDCASCVAGYSLATTFDRPTCQGRRVHVCQPRMPAASLSRRPGCVCRVLS